MSETHQAQSSEAAAQSGSDESLQVTGTPEELSRRLKQTAEEAKKYRQTNSELKARIDAIESEKLTQEGKWKELAEKEKSRADKAEKEAREKHAKFAMRTVEGQVKAEAAKLGCVDSDALLKLMDLTELEVDDDYQVNADTMKIQLEKLKKEKSYLFPKEAAGHRDLPPASGREGFKEKAVKDMSIAEMQAFLLKKK
jgi:hypothetical protein